jgi:ABC-2 type transport system permease protein
MTRVRVARGLAATLRAAFAEAAANRAALASSMVTMALNDLVWVVFWVLFFRRVGTVRGWDAESILVLQAVLTTAGGAALGLLANARKVGRMAVDGELDGILSLPVPPLAYLLIRRIEPVNLGDVTFGLVLFVVACDPTPVRIAAFAGVVVAVVTLMTGFMVLTGSLAFFAGRSEAGELGFHAILLLGSYPVDMFAGVAKLVLLTVVPAAFVSAVPARIVSSFDAGLALALAGVASVFALAGWLTFTAGLRRYTSGSLWTRA